MPVTARRSRSNPPKKAPPPEVVDDDDEDEEDEEDWQGGDEDDDDLEGFEEEEDEDDDDDNIAGILEGHLSYNKDDNTLEYKGETFSLKSVGSKPWNPLQDPPPKKSVPSFQMKGTLSSPDNKDEKEKSNDTIKTFDMTWNIKSEGEAPPAGKSTGEDEDEDDGKQSASLFYELSGSEVATPDANVLIRFQGGFYAPKPNSTDSVALNCQLKYHIPETRQSIVAATAPMVAVAAASAHAADDDDDDDDADEAMNYDELIALHEDANVNVEELKRRYQGKNDSDSDDGKPAPKKQKAAPKQEDDDDDDDDVGF